MKDFGTFDKLTDEEDTIYNRLAVIRRELDRLDLEQNEAQQDIKMWRNKMLDDKFKVKFWLVATLVLSIGALPWHLIFLYAVPSGYDFIYAKLFSILATFFYLVETFMFLPVVLVCFVTFLVWVGLNLLRNHKSERVIRLAENMGIENRNVLIAEQKSLIGNKAKAEEQLKEEENKLKMRLDSIRRERL